MNENNGKHPRVTTIGEKISLNLSSSDVYVIGDVFALLNIYISIGFEMRE